MDQVEPKGVVNIVEITEAFFEESPIDASVGYDLLGTPSDSELDVIDNLIETSELAETEVVVLVEMTEKSSGRRLLAKAARFDKYGPPIIALAIFDADESTPEDQKIESFALFADEGKGFWPINFEAMAAV